MTAQNEKRKIHAKDSVRFAPESLHFLDENPLALSVAVLQPLCCRSEGLYRFGFVCGDDGRKWRDMKAREPSESSSGENRIAADSI